MNIEYCFLFIYFHRIIQWKIQVHSSKYLECIDIFSKLSNVIETRIKKNCKRIIAIIYEYLLWKIKYLNLPQTDFYELLFEKFSEKSV